MPEGRPVSEMDIQEAEIVVYVISRISGEGKDRRLEKGDYYLSEREEKDILFSKQQKCAYCSAYKCRWSCGAYRYSGKSAVDKRYPQYFPAWTGGGTCGCKDPSWRSCSKRKAYNNLGKKYADVPFAENFSYLNGNLELEEYKEGIYVGYRYFDSFGVKPLFPFGFGLSYTDFKIQFCSIEIDKDKIAVNVSVENIGNTFLQEEKLYRCMYHFPG